MMYLQTCTSYEQIRNHYNLIRKTDESVSSIFYSHKLLVILIYN